MEGLEGEGSGEGRGGGGFTRAPLGLFCESGSVSRATGSVAASSWARDITGSRGKK